MGGAAESSYDGGTDYSFMGNNRIAAVAAGGAPSSSSASPGEASVTLTAGGAPSGASVPWEMVATPTNRGEVSTPTRRRSIGDGITRD